MPRTLVYSVHKESSAHSYCHCSFTSGDGPCPVLNGMSVIGIEFLYIVIQCIPAKSPRLSGRLPDFDHFFCLDGCRENLSEIEISVCYVVALKKNIGQSAPGFLQTHRILLFYLRHMDAAILGC